MSATFDFQDAHPGPRASKARRDHDNAEAHALIMAIKGWNRPKATAYIVANPPSPGAIVSLVFYGHELLTSEERSAFAERLRKAFTPRDVKAHHAMWLADFQDERGWVKAAGIHFGTPDPAAPNGIRRVAPKTLRRYLSSD